jgi:hypothetical protein
VLGGAVTKGSGGERGAGSWGKAFWLLPGFYRKNPDGMFFGAFGFFVTRAP